MAPPSPRRPGFSKRAQYSLFTGYVIAVAGALVALLLLVTARFDPQGHARIQQVMSDIFSPVSSLARRGLEAMGSSSEEVAAYFNAASKNRAMEKELKAARAKLVQGQVDALENHRLKRLLALSERSKERVATGRLVSSTGSISRRYATLDVGASHGVGSGQPVITSEGLVGRTEIVGRISTRVVLIVDGGAIVPVKRLSDGAPAIANGLGDGRLEIRPLVGVANGFQPRDVFVTSGTGGVYRPGIPVAIAFAKTRDGAMARPLADPARFDFAIVEREFIVAPPAPKGLPKGND